LYIYSIINIVYVICLVKSGSEHTFVQPSSVQSTKIPCYSFSSKILGKGRAKHTLTLNMVKKNLAERPATWSLFNTWRWIAGELNRSMRWTDVSWMLQWAESPIICEINTFSLPDRDGYYTLSQKEWTFSWNKVKKKIKLYSVKIFTL
jgi:hypothetical protein